MWLIRSAIIDLFITAAAFAFVFTRVQSGTMFTWINSWDALLEVARVSVLIVAGITLIRAFSVVAVRIDDYFQKRLKGKVPAL